MVFDNAARDAIHEEEVKAAKRIFNLLPSPQNETLLALWNEYDALETPESVYANAIDRAMPMLMNLHNQGQSWVETTFVWNKSSVNVIIFSESYNFINNLNYNWNSLSKRLVTVIYVRSGF